LARAAVAKIMSRGRPILVTGGSGFYLKAFFAPVADDIAVTPALRAELQTRLERAGGLDDLLGELCQLNPGGLGSLDVQNPRRVIRALERCRVAGRPLLDLQAEFAAQPSPFADYEVKLTELVREPADLDQRILQRVEGMLREGLIEEVRRLLDVGLARNPSAAGAIGYRETIALLEERLSQNELVAMIAKNTRALVKKQRTWFKTQLPDHRMLGAATAGPEDLFA